MSMLLIDFYRELLHTSDETLLQKVSEASQIISLKTGELAIKSGTVPTHICFLLHGVLRGVASNANGKDITDCIVFRTGSPAMPDSDFTQPASITLEALEYTELVAIPVEKVQELLAEYPDAEIEQQSFACVQRDGGVYCSAEFVFRADIARPGAMQPLAETPSPQA